MSETRMPTNGLRYVYKDVPDPADSMLSIRVRVLQQRYESMYGKEIWEDVPEINE